MKAVDGDGQDELGKVGNQEDDPTILDQEGQESSQSTIRGVRIIPTAV
jgi:hypothetical protein